MEKYLIEFFNKFEYNVQDAEYLLSAYDKISNTPDAFSLWGNALKCYNDDFMCDKGHLLAIADEVAGIICEHEYTLEVLLFICLSKRLKQLYIERGIPEEYFHSSMLDLKYKIEECKLVYGIIGSFVAPWFIGFFNLTLFGMGRLQFEVIPFGDEYKKDGIILTKDTKVINVHIPRSGEKLTEEACMQAYSMAKEFFKDEIEFQPCPIVCHSWLLFKEFEHILPKQSNTYKFFKSFDIFSSRIDKTRSELWRLFDTQEKRIEKLPSDTSLRRALIEHLKNGGKMGVGRGILFI